MAELFISNGSTPGNGLVTKETNVAGQMTPIMAISPERGTALKLLNHVASGDEKGIPIYMKLRDANGNLLPTDTSLQFELEPAGTDSRHKISLRVESIQAYNSFSIQEQRNKDNVDAVKVVLTQPEILGGQPVESIEWEDIQTVYISAKAESAVDWSQSQLFIDSNAVEGPYGAE